MGEVRRSEYLDTVRLLANFLVVFIHCWGFSKYIPDWRSAGDGPFCGWFIDASRIAMPTLFFLSGYLLFRNYNLVNFGAKLRSRIRRLVLPYFLWNVCYLFIFLMLFYTGIFGNQHITEKGIWMWSLENIFSFTSDPACPPMWYVRTIFVYTLISPLFYLVSIPRFGWMVVAVIILGFGWYSLQTGLDTSCWTTYPYYSILAFCMGCLVGVRGNLDKIHESPKWCAIILGIGIIGVVGCNILVAQADEVINPAGVEGFLIAIMRVLQIGVLLGGAGIIFRWKPIRRFTTIFKQSSFFLYAMHFGLLIFLQPVIGSIVGRILPYSVMQNGGFTIMILLGAVSCVVISHIVWVVGNRYIPLVTSWFNGTSR